MTFLLNKIAIKNTVKGLLVGIVLSNTVFSVHAQVTPANSIEMGLALATIPSDILAHHYDLTENKKNAALFHLVTDSISILNKTFFFYNNNQWRQAQVGPSSTSERTVNGAWLARDVTRLYKHVKEYRTVQKTAQIHAPEKAQEAFADKDITSQSDDDLFLNLDDTDIKELDSQEISRLAYTCQVVLLPILRGMSACALAWSQGNGTIDQFNGQRPRFLASALHSLVRLSQEYAELDEKSSYKKLLAIVLIANSVWLAKEMADYSVAHEAYKIEQERLRRERQRLDLEAELARLRPHQPAPAPGQPALAPQPGDLPPHVLQREQEILRQIRQLRAEDAEVAVGDADQAEWQDMEQLIDLHEEQVNFNQGLQRQAPANLVRLVGRDCGVCLDNGVELAQLGCGHAACLGCLGDHVRTQIDEEMRPHIHCTDPNCGRRMADGEVRAIIQQNNLNMNRYDQLLQRGQRGARICPTDGCPHVFGNPNGRVINQYGCPECNQLYCSNCTIPHARNISCMQARIQDADGTREWLDGSENRTLCPGCFTRCERINMCPNMTCGEQRCGRQFCLYCHRAPGNHVQGCPNRWFNNTPDGLRQAAGNR